MAQICIWTSHGYVCDSASYHKYDPATGRGKELTPTAAQRREIAAAKRALTKAGLGDHDVIKRVVGLMLMAKVRDDVPFTIIKAR